MRAATAKTAYGPGPQPAGVVTAIDQDPKAIDQALRQHLPLVKRVVRRLLVHKPANVEADELVNWRRPTPRSCGGCCWCWTRPPPLRI